MRKILALLAIASIILFIGCTKDDSNPAGPGGGGTLSAPTNITIDATTDGYGIIFSWTLVTNADSYEVQTPDADIMLDSAATSYTHTNINNLGPYKVRAYDGDSTSNWSTSKTTATTTGAGQLGDWTYSSIESCYYWTTDGNGFAISRIETSAPTLSDIFVYDNNTGSNMYIFRANEAPLNGSRQVMVAYDNTGTYVTQAPPSGGGYWTNFQQTQIAGYFWILNGDGRYIRMDITVLDAWDFTFSWIYQPVQGFRVVQ